MPELKHDRATYARAFTLVELLVVISIIAILAALLLPVLSRAKAAGLSTACKCNLHQIGVGLNLYTGQFQQYPHWRPDVFVADRHNRGANIVFCDAHEEFGKQANWMKPVAGTRKRWNNDNQPHPETWH